MGAVHLGKLQLRWCQECNLPVLESDYCGKCKSRTVPVAVTPPGDIRPAFNSDISLIREITDIHFGNGCGCALLPDGCIVLLNKCPSSDRMDEIIIDGIVVADLIYTIGKGYSILLKPGGALRIQENIKRNWVVVDRGAVHSIRKGSNAMASGITGADGQLKAGSEVVLYTYTDGQDIDDWTRDEFDLELLAVGTSKKSWAELQDPNRKGVGVKVRSVVKGKPQKLIRRESRIWDDAVEANRVVIESRQYHAVKFIRYLIKRFVGKELVVSFSGGKDSLATLLLALDAGLKPRIFFVDTGLEFPETKEHVTKIAEKYGLHVVSESAGDSFWKNLDYFGPPGKDYRWCCKVCKLGPVSRLIQKNTPNGVVALIGQRRYESEQRSAKGNIWQNAWVYEQIGASPIQNWTALHVWLYIFSKKAEYNPWYDRGLSRIGCFMCPASDMDELAVVEKYFPAYRQWQEYLEKYYTGYGQDWLKLGLWRWKRIPPALKEIANGIEKPKTPITHSSWECQIVGETDTDGASIRSIEPGILLKMADGFQPCENGISAEGVFNKPLDIARVSNMLNVIGTVELETDLSYCRVGETKTTQDITVFREGAIVVKGRTIDEIRNTTEQVYKTVVRAMNCVGCGVCQSRCRNEAILIIGAHGNEKVQIDETRCTHCGECLGPCAVINYSSGWDFWIGGNVRE